MASGAAELRKLISALEDKGYKCRRATRNNHIKVYDGNRMICSIPSTSSDRRGMRNTMHDLARAGVVL